MTPDELAEIVRLKETIAALLEAMERVRETVLCEGDPADLDLLDAAIALAKGEKK